MSRVRRMAATLAAAVAVVVLGSSLVAPARAATESCKLLRAVIVGYGDPTEAAGG